MRLAAFDLDGTLLVKNSSFAFCSYLFHKKVLSLKAFATCLLYYLLHKYCGASLRWLHLSLFDRLFRGRTLASLIPHIETFLDENLKKFLYTPARLRLEQRRREKSRLIILSNSPIFLVQAIAKRLQVDECVATDYSIDAEGKLSGVRRIVDGAWKARYLSQVELKEKEVYTDSILDLPFLEAATTKVVVRPGHALRKLAEKRGWEML